METPTETPTETPDETPAEAGREPSEIPRDEKIPEAFSVAISDPNARDEETIDPAAPHMYLGIFGQFDPYIVRTCTMLRHSSKRSCPGYHGGGVKLLKTQLGGVYTHPIQKFFLGTAAQASLCFPHPTTHLILQIMNQCS